MDPTTRAQDAADYAQIIARQTAAPPASVGFILRKVLWVAALVALALSAGESLFSFEIQTGAPQQAVAAAYGCFRLIAIYVCARAIDELTRGTRGV